MLLFYKVIQLLVQIKFGVNQNDKYDGLFFYRLKEKNFLPNTDLI